MRRFLALLLMLMLPLQFSFAAAAAYCVDDPPHAAAHFGHHDHADASVDASSHADETETECEACHLACTKTQPTASLQAVTPEPQAPPSFLAESSPQCQPEPSDRPPIVSAA